MGAFNDAFTSTIVHKISIFLTEGSNRSIKAKKQIIYSFILKGTSVLAGLIFIPLLIKYLDTERYGIWLTLTSIVGWFTFFDAGLGNGLRNKLVEAMAKGDYIIAKEYVSTTYALISLIFLSVLLLLYLINPFLSWSQILNTSIVPEKELSLLALIVFTFFLLQFIFNLVGIILIADQKPALNNLFNPISSIISLIVIYFISVTTNNNLVAIGIVLSIIPVLVLLAGTIFFFKGPYRFLRPSFKSIKWAYSKSLLGLGLKFFVIQIAGIILYTTSNIIISQILDANQVTIYNIAFKYFQVPIMLYSIIMMPIWSAVTDAYAREDFDWLKRTLSKLNKLSVIVFLFIVMMLIFSSKAYLFWVGKEINIPFIVSASMALYATINIFLSPYSQFINGMGKLFINVRIIVFTSLLYFPLAILLTKSSMQLAGVMFATCVINGISIPFQIIQTNRLLNQKAIGIWNK